MTRRRKIWIFLGCAAGLMLLTVLTAFLVVRSSWFYGKVRQRIVSTVEEATGGRAEISTFDFNWRQMRATVDGFTLHGSEPADKPPLFHADRIALGLKIVSAFERNVDIKSLDVVGPQVYLAIDANGRTNIPEPKIKKKASESAIQTILKLAIARFTIQNGIFEVESRGKTRFAANGRNLNARFDYKKDLTGPHYPFTLSVQPLDAHLDTYTPLPLGIDVAGVLGEKRIVISSCKLTTGTSTIALSGALDDFEHPRASFKYDTRVTVAEATKVLRIPELQRGTLLLSGSGSWAEGSKFSATGKLNAAGIDYTDDTIRLRGFRAQAALTANTAGIDLHGMEISGKYVTDMQQEQVDGRIENAGLHGSEIVAHNIALALMGGSFNGEWRIHNIKTFDIKGEIAGFMGRRVIAMYSSGHLPWDALASGPVSVSGTFGRGADLRASTNLTVVPAQEGPPVHGQISAAYEGAGKTLDLGRSAVALPSSRVEFSGVLGKQMRVHLETRDLDDLLPVLGTNAATLPARLLGSALFDGSINGAMEDPHIAGHLHTTTVTYKEEKFDTFDTDVQLSPNDLQVRNVVAVQGQFRTQLQGSVALQHWEADDSTRISASGTIRNAPMEAIEHILDIPELPVTGIVTSSGQLSGTVGEPEVTAEPTIARGVLFEEPFDRMTTHFHYAAGKVEANGSQINAGAKQASITAVYDHPVESFKSGKLHVQVSTNAMSIEQIHRFADYAEDIKGTVQANLTGEIDVSPDANGDEEYRLASIAGDIQGHGLQLTSKALGDAHLTLASEGPILKAHLESNAANSQVRGDGQFRMEGDYPGTATISFSKFDLAQLRRWVSTANADEPESFVGSAEGQLKIDGPALKFQALKAELTINAFEIGPPPQQNLPAGTGVLKNSGPIVLAMANNVVTVESARLTGRATDLTITGKAQIREKKNIDLRVNGTVDLSLLRDLNSDFDSSGVVTTTANIRLGSADDLQVTGRMDFQKAAFSIVDFPNGISNASGTLIFTNDRATIQSFKGETGGGQIEAKGFIGYNSDGPTNFQIQAHAHEIRVRYPEGVSTVANADLNLIGTAARSTLTGGITIVRTGFNPQSDFSSLLAKSAQPVRTPAVRAGILGGLNFDVQIASAPNIQFQSSLTQDLQMEANLHLRGTFSNPTILGRINITQGQVSFFGTRYTLTQGSVTFLNSVRIDPRLDIDLETKANGIDVTLNISGPVDKPNLTPRSDPPLQFNEIVALLATGRTPTSDPTLLTQQSTAPQSWQQMGASALLGQAIASPVAGRLQRFFGISQLRIDPTLPGVEGNPQARVTLEQQVTPDIIFTYITNVTTTNPQVVRVEWSFAKKWSVVAIREENGLFGLDFFYKKRF